MTTQAKLGVGTLLKRGDGASPEVFSTIPEINTGPTGPSGTTEQVEVTHQESTAKEFILGLPDFGEFTFTMNWIAGNTVQEALRTDFMDRLSRNFQLEDHGVSPFQVWTINQALVTGFSHNFPVDAQATVDVTIKISGKPTIA